MANRASLPAGEIVSPPRRSSLGLFHRTKSSEFSKGGRSRKVSKDASYLAHDSVFRTPPKLPELVPGNEKLSNSFGGDLHSDQSLIASTTFDLYPGRPSLHPTRNSAAYYRSIPASLPYFDPYARTESMTHRGRYSYASSAASTVNSPRRVRRRKDPTPFNILIVGTKNSGKTSFLEFLKAALSPPAKKRFKKMLDEDDVSNRARPSGNFIPHFLETEIDSERVGLTLWDSEGLDKNVVDLQLREMSSFLESKFEETFTEEMKVVRSPGVQDTHIHAVFLVLDPARLDRNLAAARSLSTNGVNGHNGVKGVNGVNGVNGSHTPSSRVMGVLDEDLDLQVLRALQGKTTVIPVISKADTLTTKHMTVLKKSVWDTIKLSDLDPLEALGLDEDEDAANGRIDEADEDAPAHLERSESDQMSETNGLQTQDHPMDDDSFSSIPQNPKRLSNQSVRRLKLTEETTENEVPFLPLSIISPDLYEPAVVGRQFPWGFADPYNQDHCDFVRLKDAVFAEWRAELRVASREQWYEGWRTSRLRHRDGGNRRR